MIIPNNTSFFKVWKKIWRNTVFQVGTALVLLSSAFLLGYKYGETHPKIVTPIIITNTMTVEEAMKLIPPEPKNPTVGYFGSKNGTKVYSVKCLTKSAIREENRIFFKTSQDALLSGYTLSTQHCS